MTASPDGAERATGSTSDLSEVMSHAARRLQEEHGDVEGTLQAITATAVRVVPTRRNAASAT